MFRKTLYGLLAAGFISGTALAGDAQMIASPPPPHIHSFIGINYSFLRQAGTDAVSDFTQGAFTTLNPSAMLPNNFSGYELEFGLKYGKYIGFAWGYNEYGRKSLTTGTGAALIIMTEKPKGFYFDFRGYWPIYNFDVIGLIGTTVSSLGGATLMTVTGTSTFTPDDHVNIHIGFGADYWFTPNWGLQALFKYTPTNSRFLQHEWTINAGLYYMFD